MRPSLISKSADPLATKKNQERSRKHDQIQ